MHGNITTHWGEVQDIIQQGDEAIIEFLKANSANYREASKLQAEAYVDEWREKLEQLKNAFLDNAREINAIEYNTVSPSTASGSGSGGGSGGSKKPRYITDNMVTKKPYYDKYDNLSYYYYYDGQQVVKRKNEDGEWKWMYMGSGQFATYKQGGLVDFTGPAWVDGTKSSPEAFLNARQTELIGNFAKTLEKVFVNIPGMPKMQMNDSEKTDGIQVAGDLIVQVDKLETEEDIQNMVKVLEEAMYNRITRGSAVGGIRMR